MEGVGEQVIMTVNELKRELAEAHKTISLEEEAEVQILLKEEVQGLPEKMALLEVEKRYFQSEEDADDGEAEVKRSPIMEMNAEEIIPKDCWGVVFRKLNAEDLLSCRQVCKTFNQILNLIEFKEKWTFHLILPLLFPHLKTSDPDPSWGHLNNARLVCRSWRHSIDKYANKVQETHSGFWSRGEVPLLTYFRTSESIKEFQERFGECNRNPFPSRSVYIGTPVKEEEDEDLEEEKRDEDYYNAQRQAQDAYIRKIDELLEQFGMYVFRLELDLQYFEILSLHPFTLCNLIKRITIHLPNLEKLIIFVRNEPWVKGVEAAAYIVENSLAPLPKLRILCVAGLDKNYWVETYLLHAFGPQLTQFETPVHNHLSPLQVQQLRNVRRLWLGLWDPNDTLDQLQFLQTPLEILKLDCRFGIGIGSAEGAWNVDKVLRNLKHLPIQLLEICRWGWGRDLVEAGIDIEEYKNSSIKTLIIHIHQPNVRLLRSQISFNFLQALTKLENLEFRFTFPREQLQITHPGELPEVVKLNEYLFRAGGTDKIYHSNVWKKVPSLKTLTLAQEKVKDRFGKSIHTREKYEMFIAEGDCPERN